MQKESWSEIKFLELASEKVAQRRERKREREDGAHSGHHVQVGSKQPKSSLDDVRLEHLPIGLTRVMQ